MVSRKSDSPYIDPAAQSYYSVLLRAGLRIYEHQTAFIHAKTMVADDYLSVIGSANMDFRSFEMNFEINCYLYDSDLAIQNKNIFLKDLEACKEIELNTWKKTSLVEKNYGVNHATFRTAHVERTFTNLKCLIYPIET